ncbi:MAG: outer membrane beta-barrel protein [Polyangiaceae bacterium]|nr:outer membrane beta-barrel protein [Polyangiaceae bacterium]
MIERFGRTLAWISVGCGIAVSLPPGVALAQPAAPEPPPPVEPWYDAFDLRAFVDVYSSLNFNLPKRTEGANQLRAYDTTTGFALAWVGADIGYEPRPVGGALSLRFGPAAERYAQSCLGGEGARCDSDVVGLELLKQAFVSWQPIRALRLDFGKFDTPFGTEAAESQDNLLYSRGAVYWLGEPAFHTGLRATGTLFPWLTARLLVVNGWNNTIDNNAGKTFGATLAVAPKGTLRVAVGWLGGPEQTDFATLTCEAGSAYNPAYGACWPAEGEPGGETDVDRGGANDPEAWRHLVNLMATWQPVPRLQATFDAVYGQEGTRVDTYLGSAALPDQTPISVLGVDEETQRYFGGSLVVHYALTHAWAVAGRGEYFADLDGLATGYAGLALVTSTLGLEFSPTPALLLRLEGRGDFVVRADGDDEIYRVGVRSENENQLTTTLGVVVRTF